MIGIISLLVPNPTVFFREYTVLQAKIKVIFSTGNVGASDPAYVGIRVDQEDNFPTFTSAYVKEARWARLKTFLGQADGPRPMATVHASFNPRSTFRIKDVRDNDEIKANVGTNPAQQAWAHIFIMPLDTVGSTPATFVTIEIEYVARWADRIIAAQS